MSRSDPFIIAVPSKGRLEEKTADIFTAAGLPLKRAGARGYSGTLESIENVEIAYLSASEIASRLRDGAVHFGITGEDLLREEVPDLDSCLQLVTPLGFGKADVVVAIPDAWIDVTTMADLAEVAADFRIQNGRLMRVATKYVHLTNDYFAANGVQDFQTVNSFGATEGAPASGAAELIVDITSTGATLSANDLRVLDDGVILKSQANLTASLTAKWDDSHRQSAKQILARLAAWQKAQATCLVDFAYGATAPSARLDAADLAQLAQQYEAQEIGHYAGTPNHSAGGYRFQVPQDNMAAFCTDMTARGFAHASVTRPDYVFENANRLYERLAGAL